MFVFFLIIAARAARPKAVHQCFIDPGRRLERSGACARAVPMGCDVLVAMVDAMVGIVRSVATRDRRGRRAAGARTRASAARRRSSVNGRPFNLSSKIIEPLVREKTSPAFRNSTSFGFICGC